MAIVLLHQIKINLNPQQITPNIQQQVMILHILLIALLLTLIIPGEGSHLHYLVFTQQCWFNYSQLYQFTDLECLKTTIIKALSYFLVLGGLIVKMPQISKILKQKSVYAISFLSLLSETFGGMTNIAYNLSQNTLFSIYGQNVFIVGSNILMMFLFTIYSKQRKGGYYLTLLIVSGVLWLILNPQNVPSIILQNCIFINAILFSTSRILQIIHIYRCKQTGTLSLLTCLLNSLGNFARFITICVDADKNWKLKMNVMIAFTLNGIILLQFYIYRKKKHHHH